MLFSLSHETCFTPSHVDRAIFDSFLPQVQHAYDSLAREPLRLFDAVKESDDLPMIIEVAETIRSRADTVVILGTGGSTLNPHMLVDLADDHPLLFWDNIDPHTIDRSLRTLDISRTVFLVISKSGGTLETLAQTLICMDAVAAAVGEDALSEHFVFISDPTDSALRALARQTRSTVLAHELAIGGRFATFTNVGLLPAAIAGLDIAKFREGAERVLSSCRSSGEASPLMGAAVHLALQKQGYTTAVTMPYIDRLHGFALWHRQIWAESLGKDGTPATIIKAVGTLDQHSQLQLYLDGPKDKVFSLFTLDCKGVGAPLSRAASLDGAAYLAERTIGDVMQAEQDAVFSSFVDHQCPVRRFSLSSLDEAVLGGLVMNSMIEIILMARVLEINAFDQPAVEHGKTLTRELLLT